MALQTVLTSMVGLRMAGYARRSRKRGSMSHSSARECRGALMARITSSRIGLVVRRPCRRSQNRAIVTVRTSRRSGCVLMEEPTAKAVETGVALAALKRRAHMVVRFGSWGTPCKSLFVMTARAGRAYRCVPCATHCVASKARISIFMAGATIGRRHDVVGRLSSRRLAVMAIRAIGVASRMSERNSTEGRRALVTT